MNIKKIAIPVAIISLLGVAGIYIKDYMIYVTTDNAQVAAHYVLLSSKVPGFIIKVNVKEGD